MSVSRRRASSALGAALAALLALWAVGPHAAQAARPGATPANTLVIAYGAPDRRSRPGDVVRQRQRRRAARRVREPGAAERVQHDRDRGRAGAVLVGQHRRQALHFPPAPRRHLPRRHAVYRRRGEGVVHARADAEPGAGVHHRAVLRAEEHQGGRPLHGAVPAGPARAAASCTPWPRSGARSSSAPPRSRSTPRTCIPGCRATRTGRAIHAAVVRAGPELHAGAATRATGAAGAAGT